MNPSSKKPLQPGQTAFVAKIIWGALTFSQILYLLMIAPTVSRLGDTAPAIGDVNSPGPLHLVALLAAVASFILYKKSLARDELAAAFKAAGGDAAKIRKILGRAFVTAILCWALNEVIAIIGVMAVVHDFPPSSEMQITPRSPTAQQQSPTWQTSFNAASSPIAFDRGIGPEKKFGNSPSAPSNSNDEACCSRFRLDPAEILP